MESETLITDAKSAMIKEITRQGILGVILVVLLWFIWDNNKRMAPIMEDNTKVIGANSVVLDKAIQAGDKNNEIIKEAVDYMKSRRGR